jgi:hypothetical protein
MVIVQTNKLNTSFPKRCKKIGSHWSKSYPNLLFKVRIRIFKRQSNSNFYKPIPISGKTIIRSGAKIFPIFYKKGSI